MVQNKPVFRESVDKTNSFGEVSSQTSVSIIPWEVESRDGKKSTGFTCQIRVVKLGSKPKVSTVYIDPSNDELRETINKMYRKYDELTE